MVESSGAPRPRSGGIRIPRVVRVGGGRGPDSRRRGRVGRAARLGRRNKVMEATGEACAHGTARGPGRERVGARRGVAAAGRSGNGMRWRRSRDSCTCLHRTDRVGAESWRSGGIPRAPPQSPPHVSFFPAAPAPTHQPPRPRSRSPLGRSSVSELSPWDRRTESYPDQLQ
ncbi:hypothetical protein PVAP13_6NG102024 [Panicum virgatum]|uniref:Uncharacterized protein n=1 Tax=Panicum virgatum TaxID=38727 RepID=A0A8T0QX48_PANVG|nr:hypothetical protein PVAP13_6NG102024 [Panicum virgatum]